jgi:hypothetical protein
MLGQHRAGCAWYAERILEVLIESIDDGVFDMRVVPRRAPRSAPPPNDPAAKKHA